jgi:hypothetical protein
MDFASFKKHDCPEDLFNIVISPCWEYVDSNIPTRVHTVIYLDVFQATAVGGVGGVL